METVITPAIIKAPILMKFFFLSALLFVMAVTLRSRFCCFFSGWYSLFSCFPQA